MTRFAFYSIICRAHMALHEGRADAAHEILHEGLVAPESNTMDPEVQTAVAELLEYQKGKLGCGHTIGDLISGRDSITQCGACLSERTQRKASS